MTEPASDSDPSRSRAISALLAVVVITIGLAVRLAPWGHVFTERGVRLRADTDPHYHVLRAERMLQGAAGAPWRDPNLGWPAGADVPWPPLFDAAIAGAASLGEDEPGREELARVAALLPVLLAIVTLVLLARLGSRALGDRTTAWAAVLIAATVPAFSQHGEVGRPDQHGAELLLFVAILLAHLAASQGWRGGAWLLGLLVAVSFWTWMGSAVLLVAPVGLALAWHVLAPADDPRAGRSAGALCLGGLGGAALLAATVYAFGPPGALTRASATGISGLHVAISAGAGAVGGLLLLAGRRRAAATRTRRVSEAVLAVLVPAILSLGLFPSLRGGTLQGLTALLVSDPWYASVGEFAPLLPGEAPLGSELLAAAVSLGLTIPVAALAVPALAGRWRAGTRFEVTFLVVLFVAFVPITFARQRFMGYAVVPLALWCAEGLRWLAGQLQARLGGRRVRGVVIAAGVALVAAPTLPAHGVPWSAVSFADEDALRWLEQLPAVPGREAVLAPWSLGHAIQYYAGKPVIVSPFGTEGGPGVMKDWSAFWFARDASEAEERLARRRVGFVVLQDPASELTPTTAGLAPPEVQARFRTFRGADGVRQVEIAGGPLQFVVAHLYYADGRALPNGQRELLAYRLLFESAPGDLVRGAGETRPLKIFGVGPGARLLVSGAPPDAKVVASAGIRTNQGRSFEFRVEAHASHDGVALLRLPYATGWNGAVWASAWSVRAGDRAATVSISEQDLLVGRATTTALVVVAAR